ncbi:MAG: TlpA family protein disulfide reductase [Acidobacteriota bacterium]|nr:TlpA family protein disulfide reductase [Acidobacteriota bacterium]
MNKRSALMMGAGVIMIAVAVALVVTRNVKDRAMTAQPQAQAQAPVVLGGDSGGDEPGVIQFVKDPQPMPDFTLKTLDGQTVTPASLRGKVAILNFWATWCGPCKMEIPDLIALQKKYEGKLEIVGLSVDEAPQKDVQAFVTAHDMNYVIAMASDKVQSSFGGIFGIPTSFVVDQQGRIVQKHIGLTSGKEFEGEVRALLGLPVSAKVEHVLDSGAVNPVNAPPVTDVPGIDLASLTSTQRAEAIKRLNTERCTCGCELTVARCRSEDPSCGVSLPLAKKIVAEVVKGK